MREFCADPKLLLRDMAAQLNSNLFGLLALDDTLPIELWRFKGPVGHQKWQATNVRGLYAELILSGAIDVVGAGEGEKMAR